VSPTSSPLDDREAVLSAAPAPEEGVPEGVQNDLVEILLVDAGRVGDLGVAGDVDLAVLVAHLHRGAAVEVEGMRDAGQGAGLAERLVAAPEQPGHRVELVALEEVALVERGQRALVAPRRVGVVDVEVREALDRREDAEQPAIAEEVAERDVDLTQEGLVVVDADAAAGVLEEELEAPSSFPCWPRPE
jgi:hypothetical protein